MRGKSQKGNLSLWIVVTVVVVAIGGVGVFAFKPKSNIAPVRLSGLEPIGNTTLQPEESQPKEDSRYIVYSPSAFEEAKDKKRVLYFYAKWCPICQPIDKEFQDKKDQIPPDVVIFKTDYDNEKDLKKKYAITYQHTFVQVDSDGNEVTKWNGGGLSEVIVRVK